MIKEIEITWINDFNKWLEHEIQMVNKAIQEEQPDNNRYLEGLSKGLSMAKLKVRKNGTIGVKDD